MRLVLGEYYRPGRQADQPGHDLGYDMVMVRVAAGGQLGPPPDRPQPDPPVQRAPAARRIPAAAVTALMLTAQAAGAILLLLINGPAGVAVFVVLATPASQPVTTARSRYGGGRRPG